MIEIEQSKFANVKYGLLYCNAPLIIVCTILTQILINIQSRVLQAYWRIMRWQHLPALFSGFEHSGPGF